MSQNDQVLTQSDVHELFIYDPDSGLLRNRVRRGTRALKFRLVGTLNVYGYLVARIKCKQYRVARIIWLYVHGREPMEIDHINGNRNDNRITNLRNVDSRTNNRNKGKSANNTSGITGVSYGNDRGKWRAFIRVNRQQIHLGWCGTIKEAKAKRERYIKNSPHLGFSERHGQ